jgi:CBS domain-containing protein
MGRTARDIMTTRVVTVRTEDPVGTAVERMTRYGFSALPVVDARYRLVGIVSLIDVLRHREEGGTDAEVPVGSIMTTDVLSMGPSVSTVVLAHRLRTYGELRVMPIVERGVLVGVVTRRNLLAPKQQKGWFDRLARRWGGGDSAEDEELLQLARPRRIGPPPTATTPVREVMTTDVVSIDTAEPLKQAVELLTRHGFTALPVLDPDGKLLGVLSEADLLGDPLYEQHARRTVANAMTRHPISIEADSTIGEARSLIADRGVRLLPVVEDGRLVGVLGRSDLV